MNVELNENSKFESINDICKKLLGMSYNDWVDIFNYYIRMTSINCFSMTSRTYSILSEYFYMYLLICVWVCVNWFSGQIITVPMFCSRELGLNSSLLFCRQTLPIRTTFFDKRRDVSIITYKNFYFIFKSRIKLELS